MKLGSYTYSFTTLAAFALLMMPPTLARAADCQDSPNWSQAQLSKFDTVIAGWKQDLAKYQDPARQALRWSQDRISQLDAAIATLEQDIATRQTAIRSKAEAVLKELRDRRDSYRAKVKDSLANIATWTDAQVAEARKSLDDAANAFQSKVDTYLDAVNADIETRQALMQVQFPAWQFN